jgi:mannan endo-1,4-beta-mannosidase
MVWQSQLTLNSLVDPITFSFDSSDSISGWTDGGNYQYGGGLSIGYGEPTSGNGSMQLQVDYSGNATTSWSEAKVLYTFAQQKELEGYNRFSFDFIYDPTKMTSGSFNAKISTGIIDTNTTIDTSKAVNYGAGLKKATAIIELLSAPNSVYNFTIGLVGSNTDYKGSLYIDNVTFSQVIISDSYVNATKSAEAQTPIIVNSDSIVANGVTQATSSEVKLVDDKASATTAQLYAYLEAIGKTDSVLYGHQNDTHHKAGNKTLTNSDTKDVTGSIAAVLGIDALSLTGNELGTSAWNDTLANRVAACEKVTKEAADQGAIITLSAHMPNFEVIDQRVKNSTPDATDSSTIGILSDGHYNFSGYTPGTLTGNIVARIMPGQDLNYLYKDYLDMIAAYAKTLENDNISVLFRPFHEGTGSWFWWGAAFCDQEAFKNLYKYTVEYLRDEKEVHNFIYVYGPSSDAESTADYERRYPGDDYVDMVGFDMYHQSPAVGDNFIDQLKTELNIVQTFATEHKKLFAVTETGIANPNNQALLKSDNLRKDWYNEVLDAVATSNASYFLLWANFGTGSGFYTPYVVSKTDTTMRGHEMLDNFIDFYNDPRSVFANEMGDFTKCSVTTTSNTSVTGYITAPISGSRILKAVALEASVSNTNDTDLVKFVAKNKTGDVVKEIIATKNSSGKYVGELTEDILAAFGRVIGTISLVVSDNVLNKINVKFNMPEPIIDPTIVDTFEDYYGENAILNTTWSIGKGTGCTLVPSLSSKSYDGEYGLEFKYSIIANGYAGVTKSLNGVDWSSKNALQVWTIPDGKNQRVVIQVTSKGTVFEVYLDTYTEFKNASDPVLVTIPFSSFVGRNDVSAVFDSSSIDSFGLWCNTIVPEREDAASYNLNSVIYYDSIKAVTSEATAVTFKFDEKAAVPFITKDLPTTKTAIAGNAVNFDVTAVTADEGSLRYQWYKDGTAISGATGATYSLASAVVTDTGTYKVIVTNVNGSATAQAESTSCILTIPAAKVPTFILDLSATKTVTEGKAIDFSVSATTTDGGCLSYQWYKNGKMIRGATRASYKISRASVADIGTYKVVVTNVIGHSKAQVESTSCILTVSKGHRDNDGKNR